MIRREKRIKLANKPYTLQKPVIVQYDTGWLRHLLEMPIDIICEVLYWLRPLDLLRLGRVNKAWRMLLMHRRSAHIWKAARMNVPGLPEPLPGMSEPAFANLCFDTQCHMCSTSPVRGVVWEFRMRLCDECVQTKTSRSDDVLSQNIPEKPWELIPHTSADINGSERVFTTEANDILDAWSKLKDEKEKERFISDAEDRARAAKLKNREHIDKCRKWFCTFEDEHSQQLKAISKQRLWDIYERLELLGYGDDFMWAVDYEELYGIEIVREPEPLTGRGWVKMCPQVTRYLKETIRPIRLTVECRAFLQHCLPSLRTAVAAFARPYGNVFPLLASFANLGEIRSRLDPMSKDDIDLKFDSFKPLLPKLLACWKRNVAKRLRKYVRDRSWFIDIPANVHPGDLVITYTLCCDSCRQFIPSTGVRPAIHDCAPGRKQHQRKLSECEDIYVKVLSRLGAQSWHPESYSDLIGYAQSVLVGCNKGDLATVQELDELDPRLSCKICCDSSGLRKIFHWREAIIHAKRSHGGHKGFWGRHVLPVVWEVLSNQEVQKLAPLDRAASEYAISQENNQPTWWCRHCEKHSLPRDDIISHVKDEHAIENPGDNDYFPDPDQPIKTLRTVVIVSDIYKADPTTLPVTIQKLFESGRATYEGDL